MKKAIFYTIKKDWRRFSILTVTSEIRAGRFVARDCYGRFETEEAAQEAKTRLAGIFAKHQDPIDRAKAALEIAQKAESDEIDAMLAEFRQL